MKIETVINMAITAVMCDAGLPQELKKEIIEGLGTAEEFANIGIKTKDMFENNKVDIFLNATWDDGYIASYGEELSTLDELMELWEDD